MNKEILKKEIQLLIETIVEQAGIIVSYEDLVPQIELDITKKNIGQLYEALLTFEKLNKACLQKAAQTEEKKPPIAENKEPQVVERIIEAAAPETIEHPQTLAQEKTAPPPPQEPVNIKFEKAKEETPENKHLEPEPEPEPRQIQAQPAKEVKKAPISPNLFSEQTTLSDKFKTEAKSINEKISQTIIRQTLDAKIKRIPIKDLKTAIGVNEKFRFVNELFKGNLGDYTNAINDLNSFNSLEEAAMFLEKLSEKYKWDTSTEVFKGLTELTGRRYM